MAAYAEKGLADMPDAQRLSEDYFVLEQEAFMRRWLPGRGTEYRRQTTGASWRKIVEALDNPMQAEIVRDDREKTNVLVLAGPGSGKTRVLVHRIAYLKRRRMPVRCSQRQGVMRWRPRPVRPAAGRGIASPGPSLPRISTPSSKVCRMSGAFGDRRTMIYAVTAEGLLVETGLECLTKAGKGVPMG